MPHGALIIITREVWRVSALIQNGVPAYSVLVREALFFVGIQVLITFNYGHKYVRDTVWQKKKSSKPSTKPYLLLEHYPSLYKTWMSVNRTINEPNDIPARAWLSKREQSQVSGVISNLHCDSGSIQQFMHISQTGNQTIMPTSHSNGMLEVFLKF